MSDPVQVERRGAVLVITLNRPEALNAVNGELAARLRSGVAELDGDPALAAGVITGAGRGFSSGMDLKAFAEEGPPVGFHEFLRHGATKPLVAAVEGFALAGGLEIALACDLLVAARGAQLGIPEVRVGLFAAGGALFRLPARLPYAVAMELALTADSITAERGFELGLVNRLADPGTAVAEAVDLAERIARNGPLAVAASKRLVRASVGVTDDAGWSLQEADAESVFGSEDAVEGPLAFTEKRTPVWRGR